MQSALELHNTSALLHFIIRRNQSDNQEMAIDKTLRNSNSSFVSELRQFLKRKLALILHVGFEIFTKFVQAGGDLPLFPYRLKTWASNQCFIRSFFRGLGFLKWSGIQGVRVSPSLLQSLLKIDGALSLAIPELTFLYTCFL